MFTARTHSAHGQARTGTLHLAHGEVRTPAFVPLATRGAVKTLEPRDVAGLGFELILGNTYHLLLSPGPELIAKSGGLHEFMRWDRPIITDSGGFQVFSMGHGGVADEIKGRGQAHRAGKPDRGQEATILGIDEAGVRFRSYLDGSEQFLSPETSMGVQAALGSDIALALDECTPFHASREYTEASMHRTHRWLERCLSWHAEHGPPSQVVYGIVQGGVDRDLRLESAATVASTGCPGIAIGGSLGQDEAQMLEVVGWTTAELDRLAPRRPRHLLGIGDIEGLISGVELGIDTFDCALPTRLGRHGVALVPDPPGHWRLDLTKAAWRESRRVILDGCPCPACGGGFTRSYLHYLLRAREITALRLVTLHNLTFISRLMEDLRQAIDQGRLPEVAQGLRAGAPPGGSAICSPG